MVDIKDKLLKKHTWAKAAIWMIVASVLITIGAVGFWYTTRTPSPIPSEISSQLTFSPLVISKNTDNYSTTDYKFSTAEGKVQILSYLIHLKGSTVSISEYVQPTEFVEIPEYKDRFLTNIIKQYATIQTANGTIYLGRAVKQNDKQLAVMIERGLLVFMSPDKEITEEQWRKLGDKLEIQKISD